MRVCKKAKKGKVGETSSKYGYSSGEKIFEKDIQARIDRAEYLWQEFVKFMKDRKVTPSELRGMFIKYYEEFLQ